VIDVAPAEAPESRTYSRRVIFVIVSIALFMSSIDATIVSTALPAIHKSLHSTINWSAWTITIYSLGMVVTLPIAGKISDQYGRRKIFLSGVLLFTIASLACGFAPNIYTLIIFRALQAVGGGALQPSAAGVVADHFGRDRDRAIGLFGTVASSGQVVGPVFGGLLVGYLTWRWIFFVNVPIGIILLVMIMRCIPESALVARTKTDIRGLMLMGGFVLATTFAVTNFGETGKTFTSALVCAPLAAGLVLLYAFIQHTRHADDPFIPMRLIKAKGFAVMNGLNMMWGAFGFGVATLVPLYAEDRYHMTALSAGTLLTARGVGAILVGALAAFALRRTGYRMPMSVGFTIVAVGTAVMAITPHYGISPYIWLSAAAGITGLGNGMANPASRNACLQIAPEEVAAITGLRQMFVYIGIIFSVSSFTSVLNRAAHPGLTQGHLYWLVAGILVFIMVPLVQRVPEHKGAW
jgi:EmrB/QacA subfamily drug resistance transporter